MPAAHNDGPNHPEQRCHEIPSLVETKTYIGFIGVSRNKHMRAGSREHIWVFDVVVDLPNLTLYLKRGGRSGHHSSDP